MGKRKNKLMNKSSMNISMINFHMIYVCVFFCINGSACLTNGKNLEFLVYSFFEAWWVNETGVQNKRVFISRTTELSLEYVCKER